MEQAAQKKQDAVGHDGPREMGEVGARQRGPTGGARPAHDGHGRALDDLPEQEAQRDRVPQEPPPVGAHEGARGLHVAEEEDAGVQREDEADARVVREKGRAEHEPEALEEVPRDQAQALALVLGAQQDGGHAQGHDGPERHRPREREVVRVDLAVQDAALAPTRPHPAGRGVVAAVVLLHHAARQRASQYHEEALRKDHYYLGRHTR